MGRRWGIGLAGALLGGIAVLAPGRVAADHEHASVGVVVWLGQGEMVLAAEGQYHVLRVTDRTAIIDEFGSPLGRLRIGDRVRERCRPTAEGGFAAIRIEIERSAGLDAEGAHA